VARRITAKVSTRAVLQRINRKLQPQYEQVRKARGRLANEPGFGEYYQVDFNHNRIVDGNVDIEELARELEVLHQWESVEKEA
jgi:hypothetical protein